MLEEEVVGQVLAEALGRGGDLAEIFAEARSSTGLRLDDRRVEDVASGRETGAGIRVISGERSSYAYTNLLTTEALLEAARAARSGLDGPAGVVASGLAPT
jgi:TldD protein